MERTLRVRLRPESARDRRSARISFDGYAILWPDGRPVSVGFDAFCKQGQRLLGLGGRRQQEVDLICVPLDGRDDRLTRMPGHRVRRFFLHRTGRCGGLHFLDGTPTAIVLNLDCDEPRVLHWIGLSSLDEGEVGWFDLAARTVEEAEPHPGS